VRLAKENGFERELMQLSLESDAHGSKLDAAKYFEENGDIEKAVLLYHKAGNTTYALKLAFEGQLFDALNQITDTLGEDTNPELLARCGNFFMENNQYSKAVHLFTTAKDYKHAMDICTRHSVKVDEDLVERLTPPKDYRDKKFRLSLLEKLGELCAEQGMYHVATKKYTQARKAVSAMKCLLKTGDTDKIIYYAQVTKKAPIFILAANYLQNADWHENETILNNIITFYKRAKAMTQLSAFYETCANVEIDDFRAYNKALEALQAAREYLNNASMGDPGQKETRLASMDSKIRMVSEFVRAKQAHPTEMLAMCAQLLQESDLDNAVRVGDVYSEMITYHDQQENYEEAYNLMEQMKNHPPHGIALAPYIDEELIERCYDKAGPAQGQEDGGMEEDMEMMEEDFGGDDMGDQNYAY
jgi:intraflagellar transport protein 140